MAEKASGGSGRPLRTVFFGTPHFAAVILRILLGFDGCEIVGVVTQPDKKRGRGQKIAPGDCAALAEEMNLPLLQPQTLRAPAVRQSLAALEPDIMVVAAYGLLIPNDILAIPPLGAINVHASLLPALRGAAPIARAIMESWRGNGKTGVSIMEVVEELDAGGVYAMKEVPIGAHDNASLTDLLAREGGALLLDVLGEIAAGRARATPQNHKLATYAKKIAREDGLIDWSDPARKIAAQVRGVTPWPGAHAEFVMPGKPALPVIIGACEPGEDSAGAEPGTIFADRGGLKVACQDKWLHILRLCAPGRKECSGRDFVNGHFRGLKGICGKAR